MTDSASSIVITAIGALTSVGANAEQSCAAVAAGMARFNEHETYKCIPKEPESDEPFPFYVSDVPLIKHDVTGQERFLRLGIPALTELLEKAKIKRNDLEHMGLMLALPQSDKAIDAMNMSTEFVHELRKRMGLTIIKLWKSTQAGHTGSFSLLKSAIQKLQAGDLGYCIVGGVDSYLMKDRLDVLDAAWRLRSERTVDGFMPGEAAVMLMLETAEHARARKAPILAQLGMIGEGMETETITSQKQSTGVGLTQAIESVLQPDHYPQGFATVYCSLNGESYQAFEWGVILARLQDTLKKMKNLVHPADCVGDIGAATGAFLIACATVDILKSSDSICPSLLWTASDNGHRIALTLQKWQGS